MIPFDLPTFLLGALVVGAAYVVFGISAFGAAFFTVPVLSHFLPLGFVLPLCVLLDLSAALALGLRFSREADWGELKWLGSASAAGAAAGVSLLVALPRPAVLGALGLFLLGYGARSLGRGAAPQRPARIWAPVAGFAGGTTGALFGIGAPPYAIYLSRRLPDPRAYRATLANMVILSVSIRALAFTAAGLMAPDRIAAFVLLVPFALAGVWAGSRLQARVSRAGLLRVVHVLLVAIGASLLVRALAGG